MTYIVSCFIAAGVGGGLTAIVRAIYQAGYRKAEKDWECWK